MYVPKHFAVNDRDALLSFIKREPFGILVSGAGGAPVATHVPIVVLEDADALVLGLHVAKANPHWKTIDGQRVMAIFHGPHAMISASWYADPEQSVPTWNYSAVHCSGTAHAADANGTLEILQRQIAQFEPCWRLESADRDYVERMQQGIVGVRVDVGRIEGVFKYSQNRTEDDRARVAEALNRSSRAMDREVAREIQTMH